MTTKNPNQELTDWFPASVKPVHVGIYPTTMGYGVGYSHWDGSRWGGECMNLTDALIYSRISFGYQGKKWRGLRSKP